MRLLLISYNALSGAGAALAEEARASGSEVELLELNRIMNLSRRELSLYRRFVRRAKELMSSVYKAYDPLDAEFITALTSYINSGGFDAVICNDSFSIKVASSARTRGLELLCYAVIADYEAASIPSVSMLDGYFIANDELSRFLLGRGAVSEKLYNFGLPVSSSFNMRLGKWAARNYLVIPQDKRVYLFLAAGMSYENVRDICAGMLEAEDGSFILYVLLERDSEIRDRLGAKFAAEDSIRMITLTKKLNIYMQGADVVLTKPLAYESYEAAVAGAPLVHITPFMDSEKRVADFFASREMSLKSASVMDTVAKARRLAGDSAIAARMKKRQQRFTRADAAQRILEIISKAQQKGRKVLK